MQNQDNFLNHQDDHNPLREEYTKKLRDKLPELKSVPGYPIAEDEDILALSDPPWYTACPNPFIDEIVAQWEEEKKTVYGREDGGEYSREPFAADVSEGKNHPIYNAHSYHTKVPHKAIMRYILHYTQPGDIVFDGFCGTGMTGVAARLCGDRKAVEELGYHVDDGGVVYRDATDADNGQARNILGRRMTPFSRLGERKAVLSDLSPAATFIAYNYNTPVDAEAFEREARRILNEVEAECGWMYETRHADEQGRVQTDKKGNPIIGKINYTVWSDVFVCPHCAGELVFWEVAVDRQAGTVKDNFLCPHCGASLTKRQLDRAWDTKYDGAIKETVRQARQTPVLINYSVGNKRYEKTPDEQDMALIRKIEETHIPYWFPTDRMPDGDESRRNDRYGITHLHHFYTKRNLYSLACSINKARSNSSKWVFTLLRYPQHV